MALDNTNYSLRLKIILAFVVAAVVCAERVIPANEIIPRTEEELVTILNFTNDLPIDFYSSNDKLMGGISEGEIMYDEIEEAAMFLGTVIVTEVNGGFSAVASQNSKQLSYPGKEGMRLYVKGDGKIYRVTLKNSTSFFAPIYNHDFVTEAGEYIYVDLYFKDFHPQFFGASVEAEQLTSDNIIRIGFMHSRFTMYGVETFEEWEQGDFELFIRTVEYF